MILNSCPPTLSSIGQTFHLTPTAMWDGGISNYPRLRSQSWVAYDRNPRGTPPLGRGVRPASQNPYPIYGQNARFFLLYLWPDQKFDVLFVTATAGTVVLNIIYEGLWLMTITWMKRYLLLKKRYPDQENSAKTISYLWPKSIPYLWQNGWKTIPFGAEHTCNTYKGVPLPLRGERRHESLQTQIGFS